MLEFMLKNIFLQYWLDIVDQMYQWSTYPLLTFILGETIIHDVIRDVERKKERKTPDMYTMYMYMYMACVIIKLQCTCTCTHTTYMYMYMYMACVIIKLQYTCTCTCNFNCKSIEINWNQLREKQMLNSAESVKWKMLIVTKNQT